MRIAIFTLLFVAAASGQPTTVSHQQQQLQQPPTSDLTQLDTKNFLRQPIALVNKNNVIADNNIAITKSNLFFTADDRVALASKLEKMVTSASGTEAETGVLTHNILKAVSRGAVDAVTMDKASAVVAARGHPTQLSERINDFLDTTISKQQEAAKVVSLIGTKDILRQPSGVVNKNVVVSDSNVALQHDRVAPSQNDQIALSGDARVANTIASGSAIRIGKVEADDCPKHKHGGR